MSQAGQINSAAGPVPPEVAEIFAVDLNDPNIVPGEIPPSLGTAVPINNILRVSGDNGIKTVATPNADTSNFTIRFIRGGNNTVGAQTVNLITQAIVTDTTMTIQIIISGFSGTGDGVGFYGTAVVKNVAGTATLINTVDLIKNADPDLAGTNVTVTTAGGSLLVNVVGVAGENIQWSGCLPGISLSDQL